MFIKPFKPRSNVQLKATEKKKFRAKISSQFSSIVEESLNEIVPAKSSVSLVKIVAHNGIQLSVYTVDKRPMFFEIEDKMFPTVYTLWIVKDLLPEFTTHPQVYPKLANGADLMLPGVVRKETTLASWGRFERDQICAVNLTSNKAIIGVGTLARSSEDLYMSAGSGICVKMLHVFGDKLWSMEPTVCLQVPNMEAAVAVPKSNDFPSLADSMMKVKVTEQKASITISPEIVSESNENQTVIPDDSETVQEEKSTLSPVEQNDFNLKMAFLTCLKLGKNKFTLPLLTSNFYALHVLPASPDSIDIKATSYKKVSKFLRTMSEEGFITVKEEMKGVEKITDVNLTHPDLLSFRPRPLPKSNTAADDTPLFTASVSELVAVTEDTLGLFSHFNLGIGKSMEKKQVLLYIKEYLGQRKMKPDPITKVVALDETLSAICDACEVRDTATIHSIVLDKMDVCYEMRNQQQKNAGKTQPIQMSLATKSGNKKVTLISNLDQYGIIIGEFAKACKIGAAASTSIVRPPGAKSDVLQVQGNQVKLIHELLTSTYKIQPRNILGLELARKEKKSKK